MFIINQDNTITIKCSDSEWRTFVFEEIDFEHYIKTGDIELTDSDSNVHKNRPRAKLEAVINGLISSTIEKINKEKGVNLSFESQMYVDLANERKKIDYVILQNGKQKIAIEVNFYSTSGSKPSEVLGRTYPEVQENLKKKGLGFIVITDGIGWESMKPVISTAYEKLDYLMNIKQAKGGELKKAILEILQSF